MRHFKSNQFSVVRDVILALVLFTIPKTVLGQQTWRAPVGAESNDMARQVLAFLPNEMWIHAGDRITWTVGADEIHTVTFLRGNQPRPPFQIGCPGFLIGNATVDGSTCVSAPPMVKGQSFTVSFPIAGNYKLVCLVHETMSGVVHVLDASELLPHDQVFYDDQAADERRDLLLDGVDEHEGDGSFSVRVLSNGNQVTAGIGEIAATPGGPQALSVVRFLKGTITVHAGDTVEWSNSDPITPHTMTFGTEPANPIPPSANVFVDADGTRHATVSSPADTVHSGFIVATPHERIGLAQAPLGVTRFRITFTQPGTYNYRCALHDNLGMMGQVIVLP